MSRRHRVKAEQKKRFVEKLRADPGAFLREHDIRLRPVTERIFTEIVQKAKP